MVLRPATDDDRDAVLALGVVEEAAWFGEAEVSAEEVGEWIDEEGGVAAASWPLTTAVAFADSPRPVGTRRCSSPTPP